MKDTSISEHVSNQPNLSHSLEKKKEAFSEMLAWAKSQDDYTPHVYNELYADNEVLWELGNFEQSGIRDTNEKISPEIIDGLIIRARRDALCTKLDVNTLSKKINSIHQEQKRLNLFIALLLSINVTITVIIYQNMV